LVWGDRGIGWATLPFMESVLLIASGVQVMGVGVLIGLRGLGPSANNGGSSSLLYVGTLVCLLIVGLIFAFASYRFLRRRRSAVYLTFVGCLFLGCTQFWLSRNLDFGGENSGVLINLGSVFKLTFGLFLIGLTGLVQIRRGDLT
jgi:hypothetical protein